jgi:hypothetical protein
VAAGLPALASDPPAPGPAGRAVPAEVAIRANKANVEFRVGEALSSRLVLDPTAAKPYFWPLNAPGGKTVTRAWPMEKAPPGGTRDHVHQKSAWFTYGDVIPEGVELKFRIPHVEGVDFWSEAPGHGRIVCTDVSKPQLDGPRGRVVLTNEWRTADGVKVLDETRKIRLINYGEAQLYVVDIDLSAGDVAVTFGDTKEGAFAVRVADSMTEKHGKGRLTNAEGKVGMAECWGRVSAWCDYSGPVDGATVGVAIFAGPDNSLATCWHSRDYGLMGANPFGREKSGYPAMKGDTWRVRLARGQHLKLRYGLFLHKGDVKEGKVGEYYDRFARLGS